MKLSVLLGPIITLKNMMLHMMKHPILFVVIVALLALLSWLSGRISDLHKEKREYKKGMRQAKRYQKRQNKLAEKAQKRDNRYEINLIDDIISIIDQRMPSDPNQAELSRIRESYYTVRTELANGQQLSVPLDQVLTDYYRAYNNDQSSQLVQDMILLNKYLGYEY